jgi:hypothetical protein
MIKVEVFYNGTVDNKTPAVAEELMERHGEKVDLYLIDIAEHTAPQNYGTINPPAVVVDGKQMFRLEGPDSLAGIVGKVIF